jgi:hypothetical protein
MPQNLQHETGRLRGRRAEDFFALKNPTASAGFELANFGTKGQHANSRPPKPQITGLQLQLSLLSGRGSVELVETVGKSNAGIVQ